MQIIRLRPSHAAEYREFMLHAYASEPEAFTSTVAERETLPLEWWTARVTDAPSPSQLVFGAFVDGRIVGVAGLQFEVRPRTKHKARLYGMFVLSQFRSRGIGTALVSAVLEAARIAHQTEIVQLSVTESNDAALRLYESCGFVQFGIEPFANKHDDRFVSIVHMWRPVNAETGDRQR